MITEAEEHKIETETNESPVAQSNGDKKAQQGNKNFEMPQDANIISLDDDWANIISSQSTLCYLNSYFIITCLYLQTYWSI